MTKKESVEEPKQERLIDILSLREDVLSRLLEDKSTKKNIIWATDTYKDYGENYTDTAQIELEALRRRSDIIRPRIRKSQEAQAARTRKSAEVFTPAWLCNQMNNKLDEDWFGRKNVFNTENPDHTWTATEGKIEFPKGKDWMLYVDSRRLEITCGEAPYLVSRYDVSTGKLIVPPLQRIGILDRKLRIVNENTRTRAKWLEWAIHAFESCYGYEYQGDNVLIARINLLLTFVDYYVDRWHRPPDESAVKKIANKIAWNIWQMNGLNDTVPQGKPSKELHQGTFFIKWGMKEDEELKQQQADAALATQDDTSPADPYSQMDFDTELHVSSANNLAVAPQTTPSEVPRPNVWVEAVIKNWRCHSNNKPKFADLKLKGATTMGKKLFDYVIGNPPYQEENIENNRQPPVYDKFIEAVYPVGDRVELIHPARFLFDAGQTASEWNKKMLNDKHLKVLHYEQDSSKFFPNIDIKGGVAITYHNTKEEYQPIEFFTAYPELNKIIRKVKEQDFISLSKFIYSKSSYKFTSKMHEDYPKAKKVLSEPNVIGSDIFDRLPQLFNDAKIDDSYIYIYGRQHNKRVYKYIKREYVNSPDNLKKYKIIIPAASGRGEFGEVLAQTELCKPNGGHTQTFVSFGKFDNNEEAKNGQIYLKTKFFRVLLSAKKVTQNNNREAWSMIPLQDFTSKSDIDWSKTIPEIDQQLYRKYKLSKDEIKFIETHVQEMA